MLTEAQCKLIETGLTEDVDPRKVAAYMCLHMGHMLMEVTAMQCKDVDLDAQTNYPSQFSQRGAGDCA